MQNNSFFLTEIKDQGSSMMALANRTAPVGGNFTVSLRQSPSRQNMDIIQTPISMDHSKDMNYEFMMSNEKKKAKS